MTASGGGSSTSVLWLPINPTARLRTVVADISGNGRDATYVGGIVLDQYRPLSGSTTRSAWSDDIYIEGSWIPIPHAGWMGTAEMTVFTGMVTCCLARQQVLEE